MNDIIVLDDVIPRLHQNYLEQFYLGTEIEWKFQKDITYHVSNKNFNNVKKHNYGFSNLIQNAGSHTSQLFCTVAPILYSVLDKLGIEPIQILKTRSFLQLPVANQDNDINNPHRDAEISHIVLLYYLTDADGDTIIYNETEESEEYTVKERVQPKKGRCVVFNGKYYHSSSKPTTNVRATININVII